jgi:hypothetical protein
MRILLALLAVAALCRPALAQTKWEYKAASHIEIAGLAGKDDVARFETGLNKLGAAGWELAGVEGSSQTGGSVRYVFKRPAAAAVGKRPAAGAEVIRVVALKNATAVDLARTLTAVFRRAEGLSIVPDERTNTLIVRGAETPLAAVLRLVIELDSIEAAKKDGPKKK